MLARASRWGGGLRPLARVWGAVGVGEWGEQRRWAGHSKWSKIKHSKAANDAKKMLMFSKMAIAIIAAVRGAWRRGAAADGGRGRRAERVRTRRGRRRHVCEPSSGGPD
jgi:hypothetical protein